MLRLLVLAVGLLLLWLLLRRPARPERASGDGAAGVPGPREMARDPVCGVYVATATALAARVGDETRHFCSPACYRSFLARPAERRPA